MKHTADRKRIARLEKLEEAEDWNGAISLTRAMLKNAPDDHWLWTRLSSSYYEKRDYKSAVTYARKALKLMPTCPLVQWDLAGALHATGKRAEARAIWQGLLKHGIKRLLANRCTEGGRWNESLLNDCRCRLGMSYFETGDKPRARKYLRDHMAHRRPGLPSLYTRREVMDILGKLG